MHIVVFVVNLEIFTRTGFMGKTNYSFQKRQKELAKKKRKRRKDR
jgi:hypothetical protein